MKYQAALLASVFIFPACGGLASQAPVTIMPVTAIEKSAVEPVFSENPLPVDAASEDSSLIKSNEDSCLCSLACVNDSQSEITQSCDDGVSAGAGDLPPEFGAACETAALDGESDSADASSEAIAAAADGPLEEPEFTLPLAEREIPCIRSFDELLATMPPAKLAQLTGLSLEELALDHQRVREQFSSWYGGCRAQAKLHRALDRGEQIYFPIIDAQAKEHFPEAFSGTDEETALLDVLKALTVVESLVNTNAISWAGAGGPWQFMRETFSRITKRIGDEDPYPAEDLRFDWAAGSRAAFELTRENLRAFQWTKSPLSCAIMAYNGGISRVSQALKRQGKLDCRQLKYTKYSNRTYIATETYLYQPRIVMVLLVMSWRRANGYSLSPLTNYQPIVLKGEGAVRLQSLAEKAGVDYKELLKNNRRYPLGVTPVGTWQLEVKEEQLAALAAALPQVERISDGRVTAMLQKAAPLDIVLLLGEDAFRYYKVRSGDNVSTICRRFGITRARLYQLNKGLFAKNKKRSNGREWTLYVGQRLRLPGLDQLILQ